MAAITFDHVNKTFPDNTEAIHDFNLQVADGELLVLVGPSGCGKSTLLRLVAGLEQTTTGEIRIGNEVVNQQPPQQRNIAMVFQNYALYPHMSVQANLEFPLRMMGLGRQERQQRLAETARLLHLGELLERRPRQLSGGQRQRVAMGRAIIREPRLFLMDEPLSNLDAKLRVQIRTEIAALQQRLKTTTLYVTHDQVEAMTLGQRVAVLNNGRLQQVATATELYGRPANIFVAGFIGNPGMNILLTRLRRQADGTLALAWGDALLALPAAAAASPYPGGAAELTCFVGLRPEAFCRPDQGQARLTAEVTGVEALGHEQLVYFESGVQAVDTDLFRAGRPPVLKKELVARLPQEMAVHPGTRLALGLDVEHLALFAASGAAL